MRVSEQQSRPAIRPCPLARRLAAMLYDALVVAAIWMVGGAIVVIPAGGAIENGSLLFRLYLLALAFAYFWLSWSRAGQTLGMRAWRIRLDAGERPFGAGRALVRFASAVAAAAALGLGYAWALARDDRAAGPDLASGSRLVLQSSDA